MIAWSHLEPSNKLHPNCYLFTLSTVISIDNLASRSWLFHPPPSFHSPPSHRKIDSAWLNSVFILRVRWSQLYLTNQPNSWMEINSSDQIQKQRKNAGSLYTIYLMVQKKLLLLFNLIIFVEIKYCDCDCDCDKARVLVLQSASVVSSLSESYNQINN